MIVLLKFKTLPSGPGHFIDEMLRDFISVAARMDKRFCLLYSTPDLELHVFIQTSGDNATIDDVKKIAKDVVYKKWSDTAIAVIPADVTMIHRYDLE